MDIDRMKHLAGLTEAPGKKRLTIKSGKQELSTQVSAVEVDKLIDKLATEIYHFSNLYGSTTFSRAELTEMLKSGKFAIELK
jgi:hypothetical protein